MANISVTYTFSNGTVADATEVNQNFTDIINGLSNGTKDISVAALTAAGTATFNGACNFGNATGDDQTFTGLIASDFKPKTDATYLLGSSSLGWLGTYYGRNSNRLLVQASSSQSASWTFTYPVNAGVAGQVAVNQGSGTMAWKYGCVDAAAKSADYTVTDTDMIRTILMTTSNTNRTVTLPTAADNLYREIIIKKVDSGTGYVIVDGEGSETIDGKVSKTIKTQYDSISLICDGTGWQVTNRPNILLHGSNSNPSITENGTAFAIVTNQLVLTEGTWSVTAGATLGISSGTLTQFAIFIDNVSGSTTGLNTPNTSTGEVATGYSHSTGIGVSGYNLTIAPYLVEVGAGVTLDLYLNGKVTHSQTNATVDGYITAERVV